MKGSFNLEEHSQSSQCHVYVYIATLWDMLMMEKDMKPNNRRICFLFWAVFSFLLSLDELIETEMREVMMMMMMMMMRRRRRCISTYISIFLYKCYIVHTYISIVPVGDSLL